MDNRIDRKVDVTGPDKGYVTLTFYVAGNVAVGESELESYDWMMVQESLHYIGGEKGWNALGATIQAFMVDGTRPGVLL